MFVNRFDNYFNVYMFNCGFFNFFIVIGNFIGILIWYSIFILGDKIFRFVIFFFIMLVKFLITEVIVVWDIVFVRYKYNKMLFGFLKLVVYFKLMFIVFY